MASDPAAASAALSQAGQDACLLVDKLIADENVGRFITKDFVGSSVAMVFTWSFKAGFIVGYAGGGGFMIAKTADDKWSAPCFVKLSTGQAGLIAGAEKIESLMAAGSKKVVNDMIEGRTPILGSDLDIQMWPLTDAGGSEMGKEMADALNVMNDLVCINRGKGLIVDYSLKGGALTVDSERNAACYGIHASAAALLNGQVAPPQEVAPLYQRLSDIAAGTAGAPNPVKQPENAWTTANTHFPG